MRKRLIERITKSKKGSLGYTLTELLVVVGIIAALCAIAIPSVIAIRNALRFAQANNYAKSIFLAAQQNLTEMRSDGGLMPLQGDNLSAPKVPEGHCGFPAEDWSDEYVYTASTLNPESGKISSYGIVLPVNSVEATIREKQVIIEYNPLTGNVYSVFFCQEKDQNILGDYINNSLSREKAERKKRMVGYYDGSGLSSAELEVEDSTSKIEFTNGEEGIVTVIVEVPDLYIGDYPAFIKGLSVDLTIEGPKTNGTVGTFELPIKAAGETTNNCEPGVDGRTVRISYALDSLADKRSFANLAAGIAVVDNGGVAMLGNTAASLTTILEETQFNIVPGENITIEADIEFEPETNRPDVAVEDAILEGINPMFEYLEETAPGSYILAVSNGRNLQNLNAMAPSVAEKVATVVFTEDIYWNATVDYYNSKYKGANMNYSNSADEAPARALPYFVPIHNENLFGTATFIYPEGSSGIGGIIGGILEGLFGDDLGFSGNSAVPTLTDELDNELGDSHAQIDGGGHRVYNIKIDATKYTVPNVGKSTTQEDDSGNSVTIDLTGTFYGTGPSQVIDYNFTGLFGYVNTPINDLHLVNPIVKGQKFTDKEAQVPVYSLIPRLDWSTGKWYYPITGYRTEYVYSNPATGALAGATGFNTVITNCSVYLDTQDPTFERSRMTQKDYSATLDQSWYGVSGEGAVGGLVGYAKSHRTTSGEINGDLAHLAFSHCFAAVNVSGNMRGSDIKHFGYSNGIGGLIGNSELTNFYNCYASGNVDASGCYVEHAGIINELIEAIAKIFGQHVDLLYNGRVSMGAGGFVGTSHGTRYTNCFSTGNVSARAGSGSEAHRGAGGFVGVMSYEETFNYGNDNQNDSSYAQHTVFENCYTAGVATLGSTHMENFSGANARIKVSGKTSATYVVGSYYRALAPYYCGAFDSADKGNTPAYSDLYIFKDSYYLSQYDNTDQYNTNKCATVESYENLTKLHTVHRDDSEDGWVSDQIQNIKDIVLYKETKYTDKIIGWDGWRPIYESYEVIHDYNSVYFTPNTPTLEDLYEAEYKEGFPDKIWGNISSSNTHAYSLSNVGQAYPFSMIEGLDYYGDWPSKPAYAGLVYYEDYSDGTTGYYFNSDDSSSLNNDKTVVNDGYAIISANSTDEVVISINGGDSVTLDYSEAQYKPGGLSAVAAYSVFRIPDNMLSAINNKEYYSTIQASITTSETTPYTMYFNPNTAISQVNGATAKPPVPDTLFIRTARQLAKLGSDSMQCVWGKGYTFIQQLNIDAATYWGEGETIPALNSIGTAVVPFNAVYTGVGGYITQPEISGFQPSAGFFGNIGPSGVVSGLKIKVDGKDGLTIGASDTAYIGLLADVTNGNVDNVDLELQGKMSLNASAGAGLLVGQVNGVKVTDEATGTESLIIPAISGCDITMATDENGSSNADVTINAASAGGAVGTLTNGSVSECSVTFVNPVTVNATDFGGFLGQAQDMTADQITVSVKGFTANAERAGGFAGTLAGGKSTNVTVNLEGSITANAENKDTFVAGAVAQIIFGTNDKPVVQNLNVNLGNSSGNTAASISGKNAAGVFGSIVNAQVDNSHVIFANCAVTGVDSAVGFATNIASGSTVSGSSVDLIKGSIAATADSSRAAGFAVTVMGNVRNSAVNMSSYTYNTVTSDSGVITKISVKDVAAPVSISGGAESAGFACEIGNDVTDSKVAGTGSITAQGTAAGFAGKITGDGINVRGNGVTPALIDTAADYLGNSHRNLIVSGMTSAGFAAEVGDGVNVSNSYTVCHVVGTDNASAEQRAGFVLLNDGTLDGNSANITIDGGYAFVGTNNGSVSNCYGWYGDSKRENNATVAVIEGKVTSSYFADLDVPAMYEEDLASLPEGTNVADYYGAVVYNYQGNESITTVMSATTTTLNGNNGTRWFGSVYDAYPFEEMETDSYPFPMLRNHLGNWSNPPEYAFGMAYYEKVKYTNDDGSTYVAWDLRTVDLSTNRTTAEVQKPAQNGSFTNSGTILESGYAIFYKGAENPMTLVNATVGSAIEGVGSLDNGYSYTFYRIVPGANVSTVTVRDAKDSSVSGTLNPLYAHEFGTVSEHVVRTEGQLANVASAGNFKQTHDITLSGNFKTISAFAGTYDGNNCLLNATAAVNGWMNGVSGTVKNVSLSLGNINASTFGAVSGNIQLKSLNAGNIASGGSIATNISSNGKFAVVSQLVAGDVAGSVFGTVSGTLNLSGGLSIGAVTSTTGAIGSFSGCTVDNLSITSGKISGMLIGNIQNGAKVTNMTYNTDTTQPLAGTFVGTITGANTQFSAKNGLTFGEVSGKVFGTISGSTLNNLSITTGKVAGKVFENIEGAAQVINLTYNTDSKQLLTGTFVGTVTGENTKFSTNGGLIFGEVSGAVFHNISGGTVTVNSITTDKLTNNGCLIRTVSGGTVSTGAISTNSIDACMIGTVSGGAMTATSITTDAVGGNMIGNISGGTVTTGQIKVASLSKPLVGNFTNGMLQGASNVNKAIVIGTSKPDLAVNLFAATPIGGNIQYYSVDVNKLDASLAVTLNGSMSNVSVDAETAINANAIGTVGANGSVTNLNLDATNTGNSCSMSASAVGTNNGTVTGCEVTADSVKVNNGVLVGSNAGSVVSSSVTADLIEAEVTGNFGVIADRLDSDKIMTGNTVDVGTLEITVNGDASVGGLVGSNSGTIGAGNTVDIQAAEKTETAETANLFSIKNLFSNLIAKTVDDAEAATTEQNGSVQEDTAFKNLFAILNTEPVEPNETVDAEQGVVIIGMAENKVAFGGLVGTNAATITMAGDTTTPNSVVHVDVTYEQPTDAKTDEAILGGLVGEMTAGTITGNGTTPVVSGEILLDGTGTDRSYIIGGAIGHDSCATYNNIAATVKIDESWAGAALIGTITRYVTESEDDAKEAVCPAGFGPVGKFVGYVSSNSKFVNCTAVGSGATKDYQFLGQIESEEGSLAQAAIHKPVASGTGSFSIHCADTMYQPGQTAVWTDWYEGEYAKDTKYRIFNVTLTNCTFDLSDVGTVKQTVDSANYNFFKHNGADDEVLYVHTVGDKVKNLSYNEKPFDYEKIYDNTSIVNGFYYKNGNSYSRVSAIATEVSWRKKQVDLMNDDTTLATSTGTLGLFGWSWDLSSVTLHKPIENVSSSGKYVLANAENQLYTIVNGSVVLATDTTFRTNSADANNGALWTYANGTFTLLNSTIAKKATNDLDASIHNDNYLTYTIDGADYYVYDYTESSHGYRATMVIAAESNKICSYTTTTN